MSEFIFALDAGHGGHDSGAVGNGLHEEHITLNVVKRIRAYIDKYYPDIDCRLTRDEDEYVSLSERTKMANSWKSDCLVSVHINSAVDKRANGFESFVYTTDGEGSNSVALQKKLHPKISKLWSGVGRRDRGMKKANFHMVREFKGASVLLELGFIVNDKDDDLLKSSTFLQKNSEAIADAVAEYFGVTKRVTEQNDIYRVKVDGTQVGAYANPDNIARQVEKAVRSGKGSVVVNKV